MHLCDLEAGYGNFRSDEAEGEIIVREISPHFLRSWSSRGGGAVDTKRKRKEFLRREIRKWAFPSSSHPSIALCVIIPGGKGGQIKTPFGWTGGERKGDVWGLSPPAMGDTARV